MTLEFYSIGVYGPTESSYFRKLTENGVDTFIDIRRRRGVRGSKYSYVNSKRLQSKLEKLGIRYQHLLELSPTKEIRQLQKEDDKKKGVLKRERGALGHIFKLVYKDRILKNFNLEKMIADFRKQGSKKVVFFCVEEHPEACHRSIVTEKIHKNFNYLIKHL